jgi:hypothetical protein
MRTRDTRTNRQTRWQQLRGDAGLLLAFAGMLWEYLTTGRRVRRHYRECESTGRVYWVDGDEARGDRP